MCLPCICYMAGKEILYKFPRVTILKMLGVSSLPCWFHVGRVNLLDRVKNCTSKTLDISSSAFAVCFCCWLLSLGIQSPSENGNGLAEEVIIHPNHHLTRWLDPRVFETWCQHGIGKSQFPIYQALEETPNIPWSSSHTQREDRCCLDPPKRQWKAFRGSKHRSWQGIWKILEDYLEDHPS